MRTPGVEPPTPRDRLVVSTTSVSPSQRARELPMALGGPTTAGAASPIGMSRVSWYISIWMPTWSGVWKIW